MKSLMKLTSLLFVETLSNLDYIMVYVSNVNCTENIVKANISQRQLIGRCITTKLDVMPPGISLCAACQEFNRYYSYVHGYSITVHISAIEIIYLFNKAKKQLQSIRNSTYQSQNFNYVTSGSKHQC